RDREPRLALYLGVAVLYADPRRAKALLSKAYDGFEACGDLRRMLMTAAHAVDCHYFEWADFAPLDRWIAVFDRHLGDAPPFNAPYDALRVYTAYLIALLFRQPDHPRIGAVAAEVERLIAADSALEVPINFRVNAASILFNYYNWTTKGDAADPLIARATPWVADPQTSPLNRVWWRVHLSFNHQIQGRYAQAQRAIDEAETIARDNGLKSVLFEIYHSKLTPAVSSRDLPAALDAFEKLRSVLNPSRRMDVAYFRFQESHVHALQGRCREAIAAAGDAVSIAREVGLPAMQIPHFIVRHAIAYLEADDIASALARYDEAVALASGVDHRNFELQRSFVLAYAALRDGRIVDAADLLREALPASRENRYRGFLR